MRGRPRLYTSYAAETAIFPTWTQRVALVLLLIVAVLLVWIGGISARLVYLQVNQHEWLKGQAVSKRINVKQIQMPRGTIYDRNERALAVSVKVKTLFADAMEIEDVEKAAVDRSGCHAGQDSVPLSPK